MISWDTGWHRHSAFKSRNTMTMNAKGVFRRASCCLQEEELTGGGRVEKGERICRHKEGLEDAYNILYNNPFDEYEDQFYAGTGRSPEKILIDYEGCTEKGFLDKGLSTRAAKLAAFSITAALQLHTDNKTTILRKAKEELRWTWSILMQAATEIHEYLRA